MKLSISNIAWDADQDAVVYDLMGKYGFSGLEIAPTRIFSDNPYDRLKEASEWSINLKKEYAFSIPSMQSIWYGRQEKIFGTDAERKILLDYTRKAIDFASVIGCKNLVFGCPRNRNIPEGVSSDQALGFFKELADYAADKGTVIGMEANPPIYNTNYINTTAEALDLIKQVNSPGFRLNLDVGTMIANNESADELRGQVSLINHVHISEPGLALIQQRKLHKDLVSLLKAEGYQGFISIEMGKQEDTAAIAEALKYVRDITI